MRAGDFAYLDGPTPVGLAHRGGAAFAPNVGLENTMAAFRQAVAMGYRYLETDVQTTADGHLLAFHDHSLERITDGAGRVGDLPLEQVRTMRIAQRAGIPLLEELLEELPGARFNIASGPSGSTPAIARRCAIAERSSALRRSF